MARRRPAIPRPTSPVDARAILEVIHAAYAALAAVPLEYAGRVTFTNGWLDVPTPAMIEALIAAATRIDELVTAAGPDAAATSYSQAFEPWPSDWHHHALGFARHDDVERFRAEWRWWYGRLPTASRAGPS
jgi:hypothetical protein